jgi:MFS family permease
MHLQENGMNTAMNMKEPLSAKAWTLLFISTLTIMAGATIAPAMPAMEQAFASEHNAEFWIKMILTLPGLSIALCAPFIGWLLDHSTKKTLMVVAIFCYGVFGSLGYVVSDSLWLLLLSRCLLGIAVAGVMVCGMTLAGAYFPGPAYSRFAGKQAAFSSFGGVVFMALGGVIAGLDWRSTFLIYCLALVLLPAALLFIEEPSEKRPQVNEPPMATPSPDIKGAFWPIALCYVLALFEIVLLYTIPVHFPFFAKQIGAEGGAEIGMAIAAMLLTMAIVSMNYAKIHRGSFVETLLKGAALLGVGFVFLGLSQHYIHSYAGLVVTGFGLGIIRPNIMTWLISVTPAAARGRVMGGVTTCIFVGQFISPLLSDGVFQVLGYGAAYRYMGAALVLVTLGIAARHYWLVRYPKAYSKLESVGSGCKN